MTSFKITMMLFIIIVIEGYIVLSTELLAIRQTIPYVGSGTDTVSIIIAAVLMPLAFGYQYGGRFKPRRYFGRHISIREKLIFNIVVSASILVIGMSYKSINLFFDVLPDIGIENRLVQISIYSALFLVIPVYLLGQTVPLVSNYFSKEKLSKITGKILFFSTVGSFLGAVFSTLVLMATLGVHHTVTLNFVLMVVLVVLLSKKKIGKPVIYTAFLALCALYFNSDEMLWHDHIKKNNQYNTIVAGTLTNYNRLMKINGNFSSTYNDYEEKFPYIEFAERVAINPILSANPPKDILVIGAGGFTFGHNDKNNTYIYVDIDRDLKEVAEKYILKEPIGDNKSFVAKPARAFLNDTDQKFDMIFLDAYLGGVSIPEQLVTTEFFKQVKNHMKNNGILVTNFILSPTFEDAFSRSMDNTFRTVFPHVSRHVIDEHYDLYSTNAMTMANVAYIYRHEENYDPGHIYTDNKNTVFYDKPKKLTP